MIIVVLLILILVLYLYFFLGQPQFGKLATGKRLENIKASPNYHNGQFQNQSPTPAFAEGASFTSVLKDFFFNKSKRALPSESLPAKKTDLFQLATDVNVLVWFGHSSYYMQLNGKRILVDPVLSGRASPLSFTTRAFKGSDVYTVDDIPPVDYLFISHDHYDHLDYKTIRALQPKVTKLITGLGVGAHLERWGYSSEKIIEKDWNEKVELDEGFVVHTTPARHFSGRGFKRNASLWLSFVLITPTQKIFFGGDSGYDVHFKRIGEQFGPFDLAILENGQYNRAWKYIHMMPEEVVQAAEDLEAKSLMPVHWAKFSLALHDWDEPVKRVTSEAQRKNMPLLLPMIGEMVDLNNHIPPATWWEGLK